MTEFDENARQEARREFVPGGTSRAVGALEAAILAGVRSIGGARASWAGCLPEAIQRIYCSNHSSHLDSLLVAAALPPELRRRTRPVAAAEYWDAGPVRRYLARRVFRSVLIERDRRSLNPLEPVLEALRQGDSLIYFPEGTRGPGGSLGALKPGIFYVARASPEVEVVPVWIDNSHRIMPKGYVLPVPRRCTVTFGSPLGWNVDEDEDSFLGRLSEAILGARPG